MRSRLFVLTLGLYFAFALLGCTSKSSTPAPSDTAPTADNTATPDAMKDTAKKDSPRKEVAKAEPVVVPAGTSVTVSLGTALGSKLSQVGQTFTGSVAKSVVVGGVVAIPKGANIAGTVTDAKPLGKLSGAAVLEVRLDSITLHGREMPVQAAVRTFTAKGKGKRTAVMGGGGAALGGIIGGLAGGGKGAAIGLLAGGGAGAGGAALTGNKDIELPAESALTFALSKSLQLNQ
jgi:hypothetical protein